MATYQEFCVAAERFGGERRNEHLWTFNLPGSQEGRKQQVLVAHEVMPPDLEFLLVKSAFTFIDSVDISQVVKAFGQLHVGAIGYTPRAAPDGSDSGGFLTISSSLPLPVLDLREPAWLLLYLSLVARASDTLELQLSGPGETADTF